MSVRETISQHRGKTAIIVVGILLLTLSIWLWQSRSEQSSNSPTKAFFTVDDGSTWFIDDANKLPPFDHNGKVAYRCFIYSTEDGKNLFVSHMERYSEDAKKIKQKFGGGEKLLDPVSLQALRNGTEVKRPGTGNAGWVGARDPRFDEIRVPRYPQDPRQKVVPVEP